MIKKYILYAAVSLLADLVAVILAPVAALFTKTKEGRVYLVPFWAWVTTHDAPVDSGHVDGYWPSPSTKLGLWWSRVRWIWRNPAYSIDHRLGYDQRGVKLTKHSDNEALWDTGIPNKAYWTAVNAVGTPAFLYEKQTNWKLPFFKTVFTLEEQYGWKLYRNDPDQRCMLAIRFSPFKRYV